MEKLLLSPVWCIYYKVLVHLREKISAKKMQFKFNIHSSIFVCLALVAVLQFIWYITLRQWWQHHVLLGANHNSFWLCHQPGKWQIVCHFESLSSSTLGYQTQTFLCLSQYTRVPKQDKWFDMWIDTSTWKPQGYHSCSYDPHESSDNKEDDIIVDHKFAMVVASEVSKPKRGRQI